jgi:hypothetical protein
VKHTMQIRGTDSSHGTGHQDLSALYENILYNGCGNSEMISTMLTIMDALRVTNVRNNNDE